MADELFHAALVKARRGRKHVSDLPPEMAGVLKKHDQEHKALSLAVGIGFMPECRLNDEHLDNLASIVGDAVHNLRAALDLMACEAVERSNGNPKGVHFPFSQTMAGLTTQTAHSPKGGELRRKGFDRATPDAQALLLSLAPHGEPGGNAQLWGLHRLDLIDKHQDLLALSSNQKKPSVFMAGAKLPPHDYTPPTLVFSQGAPLEGQEVIASLEAMVAMTEDIIDKFSRLFR